MFLTLCAGSDQIGICPSTPDSFTVGEFSIGDVVNQWIIQTMMAPKHPNLRAMVEMAPDLVRSVLSQVDSFVTTMPSLPADAVTETDADGTVWYLDGTQTFVHSDGDRKSVTQTWKIVKMLTPEEAFTKNEELVVAAIAARMQQMFKPIGAARPVITSKNVPPLDTTKIYVNDPTKIPPIKQTIRQTGRTMVGSDVEIARSALAAFLSKP